MRDQAPACERRSHSSKPMRPRRASPNGTSECSSTRRWRRMATVFEPISPVPPMTTIFMVYAPLSMTGVKPVQRKRLFLRRLDDGVVALNVEADEIPRLPHVRRQRRGHIDRSTARVRHHDAARQQMQAVLHAARQLPVLLGKIFGIAGD